MNDTLEPEIASHEAQNERMEEAAPTASIFPLQISRLQGVNIRSDLISAFECLEA